MKNKPLFSIIIPTYNRGYIIHQAIESVLNQNFNDWEMIIVDDGSTDNTEEIIQKYLSDTRIKYFKFKQNNGVNIVRNFAISKAKGTYLLNLDSDNQFLKGSLEIIANNLKNNHSQLTFFQVKTKSGKNIAKPIHGFVNYKSYLCEKVKGEYFPVVKRELVLKFPFEEDIIGGEGITWKKIVKHLGKVYFHPYQVLLYNDLLEDRLSVKRKNFHRLARVFKKDLEIFGKEYLKFCPQIFAEKLIKFFFYYLLSPFS